MADIIVSTKLEKIPLNRLDYKTTPETWIQYSGDRPYHGKRDPET